MSSSQRNKKKKKTWKSRAELKTDRALPLSGFHHLIKLLSLVITELRDESHRRRCKVVTRSSPIRIDEMMLFRIITM